MLNKHQQSVVAEAPTLYKAVVKRAYSGTSKSAGVKAFCLRCVGYVRADVTGCTAYGCPLHPYRPYQDASESDLDGQTPENGAAVSNSKPGEAVGNA